MENEIKFRSGMTQIKDINVGDAFLISRPDGSAGYILLSDAVELHGPVGAAGAQGPKGDKGDKGDSGATGAAGPVGPQGIKGAAGAQGPKGDKGDKGDTGATGAQGVAGVSSCMDYSILTEQIVPGEFWAGRDGSKKQVYTKRYVGTIPKDDEGEIVMIDKGYISKFVVVEGNIGGFSPNDCSGSGFNLWCLSNYYSGLGISLPKSSIGGGLNPNNGLWGCEYDITFKYTKQ